VALHEVLYSEERDGKIYLVMQLCEMGPVMISTNDPPRCVPRLKTLSTFPEKWAKSFIKDAAEALAHLHSSCVRVAHRDIKPENLLLDNTGRILLGDFGTAQFMDADLRVKHTEGTYLFMAPECCSPASGEYVGHDARAADVWALGVTLWVMVFGCFPFESDSLADMMDMIAQGSYTIPSFPVVSESFKDILSKMMEKDFASRIDAPSILVHPWLADADPDQIKEYVAQLQNQAPLDDSLGP